MPIVLYIILMTLHVAKIFLVDNSHNIDAKSLKHNRHPFSFETLNHVRWFISQSATQHNGSEMNVKALRY